MQNERMNLLVDFAFKQMFGQPENADLLMAFLNAMLQREGSNSISAVEFINSEIVGEQKEDKTIRLDVLVKTNTGEQIDVEVQINPQTAIAKRSLYYWASVYDRQARRGMDYGELVPAIVIQILNFVHLPSTDRFHTSYHVREDVEGFRLTDELEIHLVEMPKFRKSVSDITSAAQDPFLRWLLFLDAYRNETVAKELEVIALSDPLMEKAFDKWEAMSRDPDNWAAYINRDIALRDEAQRMKDAREEGFEKGRQEGHYEGHHEGRVEALRDTAHNLLSLGIEVTKVAQATGLSVEEVETIRSQLH